MPHGGSQTRNIAAVSQDPKSLRVREKIAKKIKRVIGKQSTAIIQTERRTAVLMVYTVYLPLPSMLLPASVMRIGSSGCS